MKHQADDFVAGWRDMPDEKRQRWMADNHELLGSDIVASVSNAIREWKASTMTQEFSGVGDWVDEEELMIRYKDKPAQLESVLKNSQHFLCKRRGAILYEDTLFTSKTTTKTEQGRTESREATGERTLKRVGSMSLRCSEHLKLRRLYYIILYYVMLYYIILYIILYYILLYYVI